uniref:Uncharacterized protein n=1 Tax=Roseihalotalea indica TaxID=2867963 RepID=A0AA49GT35_9BACT|nr:hypothetical protein K4G66_31755 [Tunicatimonas sp. TK19036]
MQTKPILWVMMIALCASAMLSGCQTSKTAYGNSHYFKQTPRASAQTAEPASEKLPSEAPKTLEVSLNTEVQSPESMIQHAQAQLEKAIAKSENETLKAQAKRVNALAESMQQENTTAREQKAQRRALRKEIKELKKEIKAAPNETNDLDKNLKIALILLIAGIILGVIPVLPIQIIGWLAFLAGLVFLLIWLVNEA